MLVHHGRLNAKGNLIFYNIVLRDTDFFATLVRPSIYKIQTSDGNLILQFLSYKKMKMHHKTNWRFGLKYSLKLFVYYEHELSLPVGFETFQGTGKQTRPQKQSR